MRPIPVDIVPSHAYLSEKDQIALFGSGYAMTIAGHLSQTGQYVCEEAIDVFGRLKRGLSVHVLGPHWETSHVEVSKTEAAFLGYDFYDAKAGDGDQAKACTLVGPSGSVEINQGLLVVGPRLFCAPHDAQLLGINHGQRISIELLTQKPQVIEQVIVRVHPTYQLRIELSPDDARTFWITRSIHAHVLQ